ncbi:hypothetical protein [Kitasatospora sp. NPDC087314]|uniref:hypothetical protein n=1 Tax=Kitasatospora sp. NPDC087314 TaxID=3364068 RepID=UPI0038200318
MVSESARPIPAVPPVYHVRAAKPLALPQHHHNTPVTTTMLLVTVPAVLAAAALRPGRGRGRSGRS